MQFRFADIQPIFFRQQLRHAQGTAAGDDRHLVHPIGPRHDPGQQRVTGLVKRGHSLFFAGQHFLALGSHQYPIAGVFEVVHVDFIFAVPRGPQRGFVDQVAYVGPGQPNGAAGQPVEVHVVRQRNVADVDLENGQPTLVVGPINRDVPIEPPRSQQRRVEHVGPIGGG